MDRLFVDTSVRSLALRRGAPTDAPHVSCLHAALDGSTPFRQPEQWQSVRGRAWAIHDGILAVMDKHWDGLRMVKQIGRHANVNTFPDADY